MLLQPVPNALTEHDSYPSRYGPRRNLHTAEQPQRSTSGLLNNPLFVIGCVLARTVDAQIENREARKWRSWNWPPSLSSYRYRLRGVKPRAPRFPAIPDLALVFGQKRCKDHVERSRM